MRLAELPEENTRETWSVAVVLKPNLPIAPSALERGHAPFPTCELVLQSLRIAELGLDCITT
jgi:hypothetical protein